MSSQSESRRGKDDEDLRILEQIQGPNALVRDAQLLQLSQGLLWPQALKMLLKESHVPTLEQLLSETRE